MFLFGEVINKTNYFWAGWDAGYCQENRAINMDKQKSVLLIKVSVVLLELLLIEKSEIYNVFVLIVFGIQAYYRYYNIIWKLPELWFLFVWNHINVLVQHMQVI